MSPTESSSATVRMPASSVISSNAARAARGSRYASARAIASRHDHVRRWWPCLRGGP
jgi:hypothetical protein